MPAPTCRQPRVGWARSARRPPRASRHRGPLLTAAPAGPGDQVCAATDILTINGRPRGVIAERDRQGRALPHWRGCRTLAPGELFALADRVPHSFASRYFGPISKGPVSGG